MQHTQEVVLRHTLDGGLSFSLSLSLSLSSLSLSLSFSLSNDDDDDFLEHTGLKVYTKLPEIIKLFPFSKKCLFYNLRFKLKIHSGNCYKNGKFTS